MKVLILDDDTAIAGFIKNLLNKYFPVIKNIDIAFNAKQTAEFLNGSEYEFLLLDVELGNNETTFDYLDTFKLGNSKIIFITGHPDYAIPAIKNNAVDYILKPIDLTDFKKAISKVVNDQTASKSQNQNSVDEVFKRQLKSITVSELDQIKLQPINQIDYFEAQGAYTVLHLIDGSHYMTSKHLKYYEELLEGCGFYRVHNSYLLNCLNIARINKKDGYTAQMKSDKQVLVSVRKKDEFLEFIGKYISV